MSWMVDIFGHSVLDETPLLKALIDRVGNIPNIKRHVETRPKTLLWITTDANESTIKYTSTKYTINLHVSNLLHKRRSAQTLAWKYVLNLTELDRWIWFIMDPVKWNQMLTKAQKPSRNLRASPMLGPDVTTGLVCWLVVPLVSSGAFWCPLIPSGTLWYPLVRKSPGLHSKMILTVSH